MCEQEKISAKCVVVNTSTSLNACTETSLQDYVTDVDKKLESLTSELDIDLKSIETKSMSIKDIFQGFVDKIISLEEQLKEKETIETFCKDVDWTPLTDCNNCDNSFCDKLQTLIDEVATLKNSNQ